MTLPSSGPITMLDIIEEIDGKRVGRPISLNDADVRDLAGIPSGQIKMSDLYGKSSIPIGFSQISTSVDVYYKIRSLKTDDRYWSYPLTDMRYYKELGRDSLFGPAVCSWNDANCAHITFDRNGDFELAFILGKNEGMFEQLPVTDRIKAIPWMHKNRLNYVRFTTWINGTTIAFNIPASAFKSKYNDFGIFGPEFYFRTKNNVSSDGLDFNIGSTLGNKAVTALAVPGKIGVPSPSYRANIRLVYK